MDSTFPSIRRLRERLVRRTEAAPVLVSVDGLQWASRETLPALRVLPRELARYPVAWILAGRADHRLKDAECLFGALEDEGASRVTFGPLTAEVVTSMLTEAFGAPPDEDLAALAAGAAGNPSLLTGLISGLREEDAIRVADGRAALASARLPQRVGKAARTHR